MGPVKVPTIHGHADQPICWHYNPGYVGISPSTTTQSSSRTASQTACNARLLTTPRRSESLDALTTHQEAGNARTLVNIDGTNAPERPTLEVLAMKSSGLAAENVERTKSLDSSESIMCRICHEGESFERLVSPCRCTGTMGLLHRSCVEKWLGSSNSNSCEICHFEYKTERQPRPFIDWLRTPSRPTDKRNLIGDLVCFMLLTPLATISCWLCVNGAIQYSHFIHTKWESVGLMVLSIFLVLIYAVWCVVAIRYHRRVYHDWSQTNSIVKVIGWTELSLFDKLAERFGKTTDHHFSREPLQEAGQSKDDEQQTDAPKEPNAASSAWQSKEASCSGTISRNDRQVKDTGSEPSNNITHNLFQHFPTNAAMITPLASKLPCTSSSSSASYTRCMSVPLGSPTYVYRNELTPVSSSSDSACEVYSAASEDAYSSQTDSETMLTKPAAKTATSFFRETYV